MSYRPEDAPYPNARRQAKEAGVHIDPEAARRAAENALDARHTIDTTDSANARRLVRRHGETLRFTEAAGWLVFDGVRWIGDPKGIRAQVRAKDTAVAIFDELALAPDRQALFRHAVRSQSRNALEAMVSVARSEPGILAALTDFDADPLLFNVANGTLDLRTGKLRPHRREDLISRLSPVRFDPAADCELWDAFLWRVLRKDQDLYAYTQRLAGYSLTGKTCEQALHFLHGSGANGKTVFCDVLQALLGDYATVASPDLIMVRRHQGIPNDIARLRGVRAVFMNETSQGSRFDEERLKDLTGGDRLTGRFLYGEYLDFSPTHKLLIRANHKPTINGTDEAIWRRVHLIPFNVTIPPEERDKAFVEQLRPELPGILRWAAQGCLEWQRDGLNPPPAVVEAVRKYREESDTLGRFIEEHCTVQKLAQVKSSVFLARYREFAEAAGERWIPAKDLPHEMQRRGFEWKRTKAASVFVGLDLDTATERDWRARVGR